MKTAISIPDPIFKVAEALAKKLKKSRSELYVEAIEGFVRAKNHEGVTALLDEIYAKEASGVDEVLNTMQLATLKPEKW